MTGRRPTTSEKRLGWPHQEKRRRLLASHTDGTPCPCLTPVDDCGPRCPCRAAGHGLPMYRDPARNPDGRALQADHTQARSRGGRALADRLLLATCNASRGDGTRTPTPAGTTTRTRPAWWTRDWYDIGA